MSADTSRRCQQRWQPKLSFDGHCQSPHNLYCEWSDRPYYSLHIEHGATTWLYRITNNIYAAMEGTQKRTYLLPCSASVVQ